MRFGSLVWLGCLWLWPALAEGAPDDAADRARESFKAGAAAYAAGEYVAAIQALDAAYELLPLPAIAFSLAQAERKQYFVSRDARHLARSIRLFRQYLAEVASGGRRDDALDAVSQLEPLAATLTRSAEPAPTGARLARPTRVMITSEAVGAKVALDGAPAVPAPLIREVTPGKHRVEVHAPGFYSTVREVTAVAGELMLKEVPLRERLSTLGVWSPLDSELYVDGAFVSPGGDAVVLQMPFGRHRLAVTAKGHEPRYRDVTLARGATQSVRLTLEPTAQRTAAYGLFIGGGAALGASLVLSAITVRAENQAESFLGKRARGNVTTFERLRYEASVNSRDQYRLATGISLAASAGMFITGLFLYELDQPDAERVRRFGAPPASRPRPPAPQARVRVLPDVQVGHLGAMLNASF